MNYLDVNGSLWSEGPILIGKNERKYETLHFQCLLMCRGKNAIEVTNCITSIYSHFYTYEIGLS